MCFDEDFVFAIVQGNVATIESFDLDKNMVNQRVCFNF